MSNVRAVLAGLFTTLASGAAMAAHVPYTFASTLVLGSSSPVAALLGTSAQLSGSFVYNNSAALLGDAGDTGFESGLSVYGGTTAETISLYKFQGQVGGRAFSDVFGLVSVGNNNAMFGGNDFLTLIADVPPKVGQQTTPTDIARQLSGFTIGDYTLHNVRLMWNEPGTPGFLNSNALPTTLPTFWGVVSLDFIRTDDPTNTAGVPYYSNSVAYLVKVQAAPVPEPTSGVLMLAGLCAVGVAARRWVRA